MSGQNSSFLLHVRDKYNKSCILPLSAIKVEISVPGEHLEDVKDWLESEAPPKVEGGSTACTVTKVNDDTFKVEYSIYNIGSYALSICLNGNHLQGSPISLVCEPLSLVYASDFDQNGFFHFIGSNERKSEWKSPITDKLVTVTSSTSKFGSVGFIIEGMNSEFYTDDKPNSWVMASLEHSGFRLSPTHYTLRHGYNFGSFMLRNWRFEASNDGVSWKTLREHKDDQALSANGYSVFTWDLPKTEDFYSHFKITQTGPNANATNNLMIGGLELYGNLNRFQKLQ